MPKDRANASKEKYKIDATKRKVVSNKVKDKVVVKEVKERAADEKVKGKLVADESRKTKKKNKVHSTEKIISLPLEKTPKKRASVDSDLGTEENSKR